MEEVKIEQWFLVQIMATIDVLGFLIFIFISHIKFLALLW